MFRKPCVFGFVVCLGFLQACGGGSAGVSGEGGGSAKAFSEPQTYSTGPTSQPTAVATGDVNGDGRLDVVACDEANDQVKVMLGAAAGFASATQVAVGDGPCGVAVADLNADGKLD